MLHWYKLPFCALLTGEKGEKFYQMQKLIHLEAEMVQQMSVEVRIEI